MPDGILAQLISAQTEADAWDICWQRRLAAAQGAVQAATGELRSHLRFAERVCECRNRWCVVLLGIGLQVLHGLNCMVLQSLHERCCRLLLPPGE